MSIKELGTAVVYVGPEIEYKGATAIARPYTSGTVLVQFDDIDKFGYLGLNWHEFFASDWKIISNEETVND